MWISDILTSGLLFEFQQNKCMNTDLIDVGQNVKAFTDNASLSM